MLNPVKTVSFQFISDGISTAMTMDLSVQPIGFNFSGALPSALLNPQVLVGLTPVAGVTAALVGTKVTLTFTTVLASHDSNAMLIVYSFSGLLEFGTP